MTYEETLDYLYRTLPMFQRIGSVAYKANLDNTLALCAELGNPQNDFKSIHVAGTNGKGSSSHMIAAILQSAGYKTGLYTSPHLKEFTERIRINSQEIRKEAVVEFVGRIRSGLESIKPSFFEATVAMAFEYFSNEHVDAAVIEVGLGGRLDSTNVITPVVSLITNIGYDHTELLGKELSQIAREKAGIIKQSVPVVISERQEEVQSIFIEQAKDRNSGLLFASDRCLLETKPGSGEGSYDVYWDGKLLYKGLVSELKGSYQRKNIAGVLATVNTLKASGFEIMENDIRTGIARVASLTGIKGRWQVIGDHPLVVCDTGHNVDGIRAVLDQIRSTPHKRLHMVIGVVRDKDITAILKLLPKNARYYFCQAAIPRALPAEELAALAHSSGLAGTIVRDVNGGIREARAEAAPDDLIFVGGSTFVVAEVENL